jgi:hypothetical protein
MNDRDEIRRLRAELAREREETEQLLERMQDIEGRRYHPPTFDPSHTTGTHRMEAL